MRLLSIDFVLASAFSTPAFAQNCLTNTISGVPIPEDRLASFCSTESLSSMSNTSGSKVEQEDREDDDDDDSASLE